MLTWLAEKLGDNPYFHGSEFGYADICVAPVLNRSVFYGFGPEKGTPLQLWHSRICERESIQKTFEEMLGGTRLMAGKMAQAFAQGGHRREYRDHRLEFMIKSGGLEIVTEGMKKNTIRFSWSEAKLND